MQFPEIALTAAGAPAQTGTPVLPTHTKPDSTALSPASSQPAVGADLTDGPVLLGKPVQEDAPKHYRPFPTDDGPSVSVKTVRGGLPDSNRG